MLPLYFLVLTRLIEYVVSIDLAGLLRVSLLAWIDGIVGFAATAAKLFDLFCLVKCTLLVLLIGLLKSSVFVVYIVAKLSVLFAVFSLAGVT